MSVTATSHCVCSTTYGNTIAMSARLAAADRKAMTRQDYSDRNQAFLRMLASRKATKSKLCKEANEDAEFKVAP